MYNVGLIRQVVDSIEQWYSNLSIRVSLELTNYQQTQKFQYVLNSNLTATEKNYYKSIYFEHVARKNFDRCLGDDEVNDYDLIIYEQAVSKVRTVNNIVDLNIFCSINPAITNRISLEHELAFFRDLGYKYAYIGDGKGLQNLYKSKLQGFEWWSGSEWSTSKKKFRQRCLEPERVTSL
jgi:hypothetical protein